MNGDPGHGDGERCREYRATLKAAGLDAPWTQPGPLIQEKSSRTLAALLVGGEGGARAILFSFQDVPLLTALRCIAWSPDVGGARAPSQPGAHGCGGWVYKDIAPGATAGLPSGRRPENPEPQ
jgi:hypothetical protein